MPGPRHVGGSSWYEKLFWVFLRGEKMKAEKHQAMQYKHRIHASSYENSSTCSHAHSDLINVFSLPKEESLQTVWEEGNVEPGREGIRMVVREEKIRHNKP